MIHMKHFAQLFTRIALGWGFLFPVMDRLGFLGPPDSGNAVWGDWHHFVNYTHSLMPFTSMALANIMALLTTLAECILALGLIIGYKTKWMGLGAAIITVCFAVMMMLYNGLLSPFKYPVFVFTAAGLLLSTQPYFKWSIDALLLKHFKNQ
jgi:uncharacterized membrane protein YphA (DoxX/SURF4 family)